VQGIIDNTNQTVDMAALLRDMKKTVDEFKLDSQTALAEPLIQTFNKKYGKILKLGEVESPRDADSRKQSKSRNLLDRFKKESKIPLSVPHGNHPFCGEICCAF
jgi:hypothetical protein